jgi:hypothetical protein
VTTDPQTRAVLLALAADLEARAADVIDGVNAGNDYGMDADRMLAGAVGLGVAAGKLRDRADSGAEPRELKRLRSAYLDARRREEAAR